MFAVGLNLSEKDFTEAFKRPIPIFTGYVCQFVLKPLLGYLFGTLAITLFRLPTSLSNKHSSLLFSFIFFPFCGKMETS